MDPAKSFKQLIVWQKAHEFVVGVYGYSKGFPKERIFALSSQFKRAATSIAANIAEGFAKRSKADKVRLLNIAQGSLEEGKYFLILSNDDGYGANEKLSLLSEEVSRLLSAYIKAIEQSK